MRTFALLIFAIPGLVAQTATAATVHVPDGDCGAFSAAASVKLGSEPVSILLAPRGHYGTCQLVVSADVSIDGNGATMKLEDRPVSGRVGGYPQIQVQPAGTLVLRDINLGYPDGQSPPLFSVANASVIVNAGALFLDSASVSGMLYNAVEPGFDHRVLISNWGQLTIRNTTFANNVGPASGPMVYSSGSIEIVQSTFAANNVGANSLILLDGSGTLTFANSLLANTQGPLCSLAATWKGDVVSRGGNALTDNSCRLANPNDRVVADAKLGAFGDNGGLVATVALTDRSPAIGNGLAANCEGADARGVVRNVADRGGCDAGAYEYGGGRGLLAQGGMNGFFYDAAADGHYVTVQRLDWGSALVIWNTFDRDGNAAWIYAIGMVGGRHIHAQAAQNVGGRLQPGAAPTGGHGIVWGTIDVDFADCFDATFHYDSPLPNFGSGQFPLDRLAFLGDLDCSD